MLNFLKSRQREIVWTAYFLILAFFVLLKFVHLFYDESPQFLFYFILRSFNKTFMISYLATVFQAFISAIHLIPLWCYIYRIRFGDPVIWQCLLAARLILDICGNSYQLTFLISLYYASPVICTIVFVQTIASYIPSYVACYRYAFRQDKLFAKNK